MDIRDAETGESVRSFHGHDLDVNDVAFSRDGAMLATAGDDGAARIWDPDTGEELWSFESPDHQIVWGPSFSPDDSRLAVVWLEDQLVRVIDLATGRTVREIPSGGAHFAVFSPDGERLAMVGEGQPAAVVVDATTGDEVFTLEGHRLGLRDVAWSPDGRWIATSSYDATARIWEAETGQLRFTLSGHGADVVAVDWSPDSSRLITGSMDGTAKLWRITDQGGMQVFSLSTHDTRAGVWGVAFSPGGDRVMAGNLTNTRGKRVGREPRGRWGMGPPAGRPGLRGQRCVHPRRSAVGREQRRRLGDRLGPGNGEAASDVRSARSRRRALGR